jgi:hypothetical protein
MTDADLERRIADLELEVHYLVQLVDDLYRRLGLGLPGSGGQGADSAPSQGAGPAPGPIPTTGSMPPPPDEELRAALTAGNMIQAIKRYRELTGLGLREAKEAVEAMAGRR